MQTPLPSPAPTRTAGQAIIFIIFALFILFFVVLWNFDLHKTLRVKMVSQNGGDAAAIMAARWQGISLNLLGDLNIVKALALSANDSATLASVSNLQARLALVGPMIGFMAAQQAAKNNGVHQNDDFSRMIREHAHVVRVEYTNAVGPNGEMMFPEPYPGAWGEYADMLDLVAQDGVAAAPDNARYFSDYVGDHILLDPAFYDAVAGRNWCWFYHEAPGLLQNYTDYTWWPDLPDIIIGEYINSEIFGLGLCRRLTAVSDLADTNQITTASNSRGLGNAFSNAGLNTNATWYCYGEPWTAWLAMSQDGDDPFPSTGPLRPQYDYAGADAAVRVMAHATRVTPGSGGLAVSNTITWTAAAKPFGYLPGDEPPTLTPLVLPAYHDARLIPMDASSAAGTGGFDPEWRRFIEQDLPVYLATGQLNCSSYYCNQLRTWEDPVFRQDGVDWLAKNSSQCTAGGGGGGGHRGGRRKGH
ncbi:MAG: hypothetical protein K8T26_09660 [Lentisphaerae bacterium]|nr:hypothetical protein [Lentisphaerota bacterium]